MSLEGYRQLALKDWRGLELETDPVEANPVFLREALNVRHGTRGLELRPPLRFEGYCYDGGLWGQGGGLAGEDAPGRVTALLGHIPRLGQPETVGIMSDGRTFRERAQGFWDALDQGMMKEQRAVGVSRYNRLYFGLSDGVTPTDYPRAYDAEQNGYPWFRPVGVDPPASGPGITAVAGGQMAVGVRNAVLIFVSKWGEPSTISGIGTINNTTANQKLRLTIPIGPEWVAQRWIFISPAGGGSKMFCCNALRINDNTTTTVDLNVDEDTILSGEEVATYRRNYPVPACRGFADAGDRILAYGCRPYYFPNLHVYEPPVGFATAEGTGHTLGFFNIRFNGGGWQNDAHGSIPGGWTWVDADSTGCTQISNGPGALGDSYAVTGNGTAARHGGIRQTVSTKVVEGYYLFQAGKKYGVRVKARCTGAPAANKFGCLRVRVRYGTVTGTPWIDLYIKQTTATTRTNATNVKDPTVTGLETYWQIFESPVVEWTQDAVAGLNHQVTLQVYHDTANGILAVGDQVVCDWLEFFEEGAQESSLMFFSMRGRPSQFDWLNGVRSVQRDDGQPVMSAFRIANQTFVVKSNSIWAITEVSGTEPANWMPDIRSERVGTPSVNGVGVADAFAVIAADDGCYLFTGGEPTKISSEIESKWLQLMQRGNSSYRTAWVPNRTQVQVVVDTQEREIHVIAPDEWLVCDYRNGLDPGARRWTNRKRAQNQYSGAVTGQPTASAVLPRRDKRKQTVFAFINAIRYNAITHSDDAPQPGTNYWTGSGGCAASGPPASLKSRFPCTVGGAVFTGGYLTTGTGHTIPAGFNWVNAGIDVYWDDSTIPEFPYAGAFGIGLELRLDGVLVASDTFYPPRAGWFRPHVWGWGNEGATIELRISTSQNAVVYFAAPALGISAGAVGSTAILAGEYTYFPNTGAAGYTQGYANVMLRHVEPTETAANAQYDQNLFDCGGAIAWKVVSHYLLQPGVRFITAKVVSRQTGAFDVGLTTKGKSGVSTVWVIPYTAGADRDLDIEKNVEVQGFGLSLSLGNDVNASWKIVDGVYQATGLHEFSIWVRPHPTIFQRFGAP